MGKRATSFQLEDRNNWIVQQLIETMVFFKGLILIPTKNATSLYSTQKDLQPCQAWSMFVSYLKQKTREGK